MATPEQLLQALQAVVDPNTGKDFVSTKQLRNLSVEGGSVSFDVELGYPAKSQIPALRQALIAAAKGMAWESPRGPMSIDPATRQTIQNVYLREVKMVNGKPWNVEFDSCQYSQLRTGSRRGNDGVVWNNGPLERKVRRHRRATSPPRLGRVAPRRHGGESLRNPK